VFQYVSAEFVNLFAFVAGEQVFHILYIMHGFEVGEKRKELGKIETTTRTMVLVGSGVFVVLDVVAKTLVVDYGTKRKH
jgi:rhamnose utilization protein RhaD (predicted bifunctional aldolase and dehydrogenase)